MSSKETTLFRRCAGAADNRAVDHRRCSSRERGGAMDQYSGTSKLEIDSAYYNSLDI